MSGVEGIICDQGVAIMIVCLRLRPLRVQDWVWRQCRSPGNGFEAAVKQTEESFDYCVCILS